jgi:hypothetical protein
MREMQGMRCGASSSYHAAGGSDHGRAKSMRTADQPSPKCSLHSLVRPIAYAAISGLPGPNIGSTFACFRRCRPTTHHRILARSRTIRDAAGPLRIRSQAAEAIWRTAKVANDAAGRPSAVTQAQPPHFDDLAGGNAADFHGFPRSQADCGRDYPCETARRPCLAVFVLNHLRSTCRS